MFHPNFKEFCQLTKKGNLIPVYIEIPADMDTPVSAFLKIKQGRYGFLFESVEGGETWGRFSFIGTEPRAVFKSRGAKTEVLPGAKKGQGDPLQSLEDLMSLYKPVAVEGLPRFYGGAVGFLAYDMVRHFEKLPQTARDDLGLDDSYFMLTDVVAIFDNLRQVIQIVCPVFIEKGISLKSLYHQAQKKINKVLARLRKPLPPSSLKLAPLEKVTDDEGTLKGNRSEVDYCALVEKAKEYVKAGDIFQVQISMRFEGKTRVSPFALYRALRRYNPSPYLYYLHLPDMAIVGASPELMVRLEEGRVELRPIAGTRRRGHTPDEDKTLEAELKSDPKERAEHIMLVDLGRNDLGRVCQTGSVRLDELEVVERYSHVMHLVSQVSGLLRKDKNAFDLIRATFPAGTLTGAPKIRAMEIIEELEGVRRGLYGGAVGYIGYSGNLDMAITIRTALFYKGKIFIQAAGGIVYDSVPRLEYKECHNKARALLRALKSVS